MEVMENIRKTLASNVKKYRKSMGLTQEGLAEKSGISISFLKDIEGEKSLGTAGTLEKLGDSLDKPVYVLFMSDEDQAEDPIDLLRTIVSLGPSQMRVLKETLKTLKGTQEKKSLKKEG